LAQEFGSSISWFGLQEKDNSAWRASATVTSWLPVLNIIGAPPKTLTSAPAIAVDLSCRFTK
jgi:hypothetical protein